MNLKLRQLREERGYTQRELGDAIGVTLRKISSWENLEVRIPLLDAARIADVFGCSLDELAGRDWHPASDYADPRQAELNRCWESLDPERQDRIIASAQDMEIAKSGQGVPSAYAREA